MTNRIGTVLIPRLYVSHGYLIIQRRERICSIAEGKSFGISDHEPCYEDF